jgi:cobalt/nickel transport system permease protein
VHRLPAHVKIVALFAFVVVVVATPRTAFAAFAAYLLLLVGVVSIARIPPGFVLRRMVIEVPFVVFAVLLPFIAAGEQVTVFGVEVSRDGLLAGWNIIAKGTIGVVASITLAATTEPHDLVVGLQRLRTPNVVVQILSFMIRYLDVVGEEMQRMRIARESRAFQARHLGHLRVVAHAAGALFIRSYERGERVHLAMLSRGYRGSFPLLGSAPAPAAAWATAAVLPVAALVVAVTVVGLR